MEIAGVYDQLLKYSVSFASQGADQTKTLRHSYPSLDELKFLRRNSEHVTVLLLKGTSLFRRRFQMYGLRGHSEETYELLSGSSKPRSRDSKWKTALLVAIFTAQLFMIGLLWRATQHTGPSIAPISTAAVVPARQPYAESPATQTSAELSVEEKRALYQQLAELRSSVALALGAAPPPNLPPADSASPEDIKVCSRAWIANDAQSVLNLCLTNRLASSALA